VHAIFNFFSSLKLTVVTLFMSLVLVFVGTLAQVKLGLYIAQEKYFSSLFVFWGPRDSDWQIPVWPGGYLLGAILLLNLVAAHIKRFEFSRKKFGIFIVHAGLILMFLGQFTTQILQVESVMAIPAGGSKNYSESIKRSELAVIDVTDADKDKVVSIPERVLAKKVGYEIRVPELPFAIKVKSFLLNSTPGKFEFGKGFQFASEPRAIKMNERDIPATTFEVVADGASKGQYTVSNWLCEEGLLASIQRQLGGKLPPGLTEPQTYTHNGRKYVFVMRQQRFYKPFTITLLKFNFDRYLGTNIPKNYSSRIRIQRPGTGEDREVLIYMNNPLRYWGETYYQQSFSRDETGTVLQVVNNPSWLTPYVACVMVGLGLIIQFLMHLVGFAKKRKVA